MSLRRLFVYYLHYFLVGKQHFLNKNISKHSPNPLKPTFQIVLDTMTRRQGKHWSSGYLKIGNDYAQDMYYLRRRGAGGLIPQMPYEDTSEPKSDLEI